MKIKKEDRITEVLEKYPATVEVFMRYQLPCLGCFAAHYETLEQGLSVHGIDVDDVIEELNEVIGL